MIALFGFNNRWNAFMETDVEPEVTAFLEGKQYRGPDKARRFENRRKRGS